MRSIWLMVIDEFQNLIWENPSQSIVRVIIILMDFAVPSIFEIILTGIRPFFSQNTRDILRVFGTNRREYQPVLFKDIKLNQLPPDLGGTDDGTLYPEFDVWVNQATGSEVIWTFWTIKKWHCIILLNTPEQIYSFKITPLDTRLLFWL